MFLNKKLMNNCVLNKHLNSTKKSENKSEQRKNKKVAISI